MDKLLHVESCVPFRHSCVLFAQNVPLGRVYIDMSTSCESEFYTYELLVRVLFTLRIHQYEYAHSTTLTFRLTDAILLCSIYELPKNMVVPTFTSTSCSLRVPALVYV